MGNPSIEIELKRKTFEVKIPYDKEIREVLFDSGWLDYDTKKKLFKGYPYGIYKLYKYLNKNDKPHGLSFVNEKTKEVFENELNFLKDHTKTTKEIIDFKENIKEQITDIDFKEYLKEQIKPFEHQKYGAYFSYKYGNCILGYEQGTGKTLTALLACEMKKYKKVLIVCPNSLKYNWYKEVLDFTNSKPYIINPSKKTDNQYSVDEAKYLIVNYDYFKKAPNEFKKKDYFEKRITSFNLQDVDCLVFDEAHFIKNFASNMYKNLFSLYGESKEKQYEFILLSGTIMPNGIEELYAPLHLMFPKVFVNKTFFLKVFCNMQSVQAEFGTKWIFKEDTSLDDLYNKIAPYILRVKKDDVLDLPEKNVYNTYIDLSQTQYKEYEKIINDSKSDGEPAIKTMLRLRAYVTKVKMDYLKTMVKRLNGSNEKVVIFDAYKNSLDILKQEIPRSEIINGTVKVSDRQKYVQEFQEDNNRLMNLLLTIKAGNVGLTLTKSRYLFMLNLDYVPANNFQAYDRIHRIGQNRSVFVNKLLVRGTIDETIMNLLEEKEKLINKLIDNEENIESGKNSIYNDVIKSIEKMLM